MNEISPERTAQILELLNSIEKQYQVTIFHAVESGSRAWGFPSADSDYDIRFIYHHPREWYITAFDKTDHISLAISDDLDANGWDIGKSLRLLYKGNTAILEWLNSPVVYRNDKEKHQALSALATKVFNPAAGFYHYLALAHKKFSDPKTPQNAKYFLYGLRSLLSAKWIAEKQSIPPVAFELLTSEYLTVLQQQNLQQVLHQKAKAGEQDKLTIPDRLWRDSVDLFEQLQHAEVTGAKPGSNVEFDRILNQILA